jgi:pectinesterase inhibitor-like protein
VIADLVDDACMKTDNPVFCTSTLRSAPGSASADAKCLARIMLQVVQTKTNETYGQVEILLGQAIDPVVKDMLTNFGYEYESGVVGSCPDAIEKFDIGLFRISQGNMEDVAGSAESCEQFFSCEY